MALPQRVRRLTPPQVRDSVRLRALALSAGLIPPRAMHTAGEAEQLASLVAGRRTVVELGVYEGGSAVVLCRALGPGATLHLVDPFTEGGWALRAGLRGVPAAARRVVARAARDGPAIRWHIDYSQRLAERWRDPADVVFIDGDHSEAGCRADWELWHPFVVPGGLVLFHDARLSQPGGAGLPGPTAVVDAVFRAPAPPPGWRIVAERDSLVAVERG
jgi:predicted O-methyltransferase YrrM